MKKITSADEQKFPKKIWVLLILLITIAIGYTLPLNSISAATPTNGTLTPTATGATTWSGTGTGPTTNDESTCVEGVNCDSFALTLSGVPTDWTGKTAHLEINWMTVATDYDMIVHKGNLTGPIVGTSASGTTNFEAVDLNPATIGTGLYTVHILYFAATAADQYSGKASVRTASTGILPATLASGPAPRFQNFNPPQATLNAAALGTNAGEPSLGVNWRTGKVFFQSNLTTFRISFDDTCTTSPSAIWEDKSPMTSANSLDPIMYTDHGYNNVTPTAGRTIVSQLSGTTSLSSTTDTDGDLWIPSTGGGLTSGVDHQTVGGSGPFHAPLLPTVYPNATYYCSQDIADATCSFSADGGQTYAGSVPIYTLLDCGGLHGHVKVGPDGTAYVPNKGCGGNQAVVASENNGATWEVRRIPNTSSSSSDPSVAVGRGDVVKTFGRLYFGFANTNSKAVVATSDDNGRTWKNYADVGAAVGINNVAFPTMLAGDDDRAAFAFMGSTTLGAGDDRAFPGMWNLYVATTYDGGLTWVTVNATPNDPIQHNGIWLGGGSPAHRNMLDFIGADIDKTGHVLVGYADGCTGAACIQAPATATGNSYTALSAIARQTGGRTLFASNDVGSGLTVPGAPSITVGRNGTTARITLSQPDNGGSAITNYRILRGTTSGGETQLTTLLGSTLAYNDTTADATTTYFYKVIAANAQGDSCGNNEVVSKPTGNSCTAMTVVTDVSGDQRAAPANTDLDIQSISMAEPYYSDGTQKLAFKLRLADGALLPDRQYRIIWNYPIKAADIPAAMFTGTYYVGMNTDAATSARTFEYGTVTTNETVPANTSMPNRIGTADVSSSFDLATRTITIVVDTVKVGTPRVGDVIGRLIGRTFAGNGNQTVLGNSAIDSTGTIGSVDPYTGASYRLIGNSACLAAPTAASVDVGGRVTNATGRGIGGVSVTAADNTGNLKSVRTNPFGYYRFNGIRAGQTYVFSAQSKQYSFSQRAQVLNINESVDNVNFTAAPPVPVKQTVNRGLGSSR